MATAGTCVRARIDTATKHRAAEALEAMGLSISDAIRLLMLRIADERRLPFDIHVPNATTRRAIAELERGKGNRVGSVKALLADLNVDHGVFLSVQARLQASQRDASVSRRYRRVAIGVAGTADA